LPDEAWPALSGSSARDGPLRRRVIGLIILLTALGYLWSGIQSAARVVGGFSRGQARVELGVLGLVVGLGILQRRPWAWKVARAVCWITAIGLCVLGMFALNSPRRIEYDLPPSLASLAGPWLVVAVVGLAVALVIGQYAALSSPTGRAWFGLAAPELRPGGFSAWMAGGLVGAVSLAIGFLLVESHRRLERVGAAGGAVSSVAVDGGYAYVVLGGALGVLDLADPDAPVLVGRAPPATEQQWSQSSSRLAVDGPWVFAILPEAMALATFDASDPTRPQPLGPVGFTDVSPTDIAALGATAFVVGQDANGAGALVVLDAAGAITPTVESRYAYGANLQAIEAGFNDIYILATHPLRPCDGPPREPAELWVMDGAAWILDEPKWRLPLPIDSANLWVRGERGYVVTTAGRLLVLDLSETAGPTILGSATVRTGLIPSCVTPASAPALVAVGDHVYVSFPGDSRVTGVNVSDPTDPRLEGVLAGGGLEQLAAGGARLYGLVGADTMADGPWTLAVVDASDPRRLRLSGRWRSFSAAKVVVTGARAVVLTRENTLRMLSLDAPSQPVDLDLPLPGNIADVAADGGEFYAVTHRGAFMRLGATTGRPAAALPVPLGSGGWPRLAVAHGLAYLFTNRNTLHLVDVSDPDHPRLRGTMTPAGTIRALDAGPLHAYVAVEQKGLSSYSSRGPRTVPQVVVLDVSEPDAPRAVGEVLSWRPIEHEASVQVVAHHLYVGDGYSLRAYNLDDPTHPELAGSLSDRAAYSLAVAEDGLFAASSTLRLYWIGPPLAGRERATLGGFSGGGIAARGRYVYVADGERGLTVVEARHLLDGPIDR